MFVSETSYTMYYAPATLLNKNRGSPLVLFEHLRLCTMWQASHYSYWSQLLNRATVIAVYVNLFDLICEYQITITYLGRDVVPVTVWESESSRGISAPVSAISDHVSRSTVTTYRTYVRPRGHCCGPHSWSNMWCFGSVWQICHIKNYLKTSRRLTFTAIVCYPSIVTKYLHIEFIDHLSLGYTKVIAKLRQSYPLVVL